MKRRSFLATIVSLPLLSCTDESTAIRFKVIASATVDGKPIESSSVMEISYARVTHSAIGSGGATRLYGEALIFDLAGRGTIYVLPVEHPSGQGLHQIYEYGILTTLGIKDSVGGLTSGDFDRLRAAQGRFPFKLSHTQRLPAFVAFSDEQDPKTIFEIDPWHLEDHFPGVRFTGLDIQITNEEVSSQLRQRLPWLNVRKQVFERDKPGQLRPESELPIGFMITQARFFGNGSRGL